MSSKRPTQTDQNDPPPKRAKVQSSVRNFFSTANDDDVIDLTDDNANSNANSKTKYKVFCDLDGVLVDFVAAVEKINRGKPPKELSNRVLWGSIARSYRFFENAPWTNDGKKLWQHLVDAIGTATGSGTGTIQSLDILTGVASNFEFRTQKYKWCKRELEFAFAREGEHGSSSSSSNSSNVPHRRVEFNHVDMAAKNRQHERVSGSKRKFRAKAPVINVITCHSKNKYRESRRGHVLIDDRDELEHDWTRAGGIFIHHTNTERTLKTLKAKGILPSDDIDSDNDSDRGSDIQKNSASVGVGGEHSSTKCTTSTRTKRMSSSSNSSSTLTSTETNKTTESSTISRTSSSSKQEVIDLSSDSDDE